MWEFLMKKIDKKGIVKLIILVILLIAQIKAFKDSRGEQVNRDYCGNYRFHRCIK